MLESGSALQIKEPKGLSPRIKFLRDYYFLGANRKWNNENTSWSTGTPWDVLYNELSFYIVPETYLLTEPIKTSYELSARNITLHKDFWSWGLPGRRAWFNKEVMVNYLPKEILPGDLIAGGRFNIQTSLCLNKSEAEKYNRVIYGKKGLRAETFKFHAHGYGNTGATSGHLIPDYPKVLRAGFSGIIEDLKKKLSSLPVAEKKGAKGEQLRAMITASNMPIELAAQYASLAGAMEEKETDPGRKKELASIRENLTRVPKEGAVTFWEAVQSLWLSHMLVMSDENYPGPGVSFGRIDQYLYPYWERSIKGGMDREFGKEILKSFWIHANTAYDSMIRTGNQGITAGFGQLITLSGMGIDGADMTNDLTYAILEVIDEMSPILEPKPNVRIHRGTPEKLLSKLVEMISTSQGAPFILNFDERSMAGLLREARLAGITHKINLNNVFDYAPVGCLENTMCGNDRSGTVDNNLNLVKAVELALSNGKDMLIYKDPLTGIEDRRTQDGPKTGDPVSFKSWTDFFGAYKAQTKYIIKKIVSLYERSESLRASFFRTPYLSTLVNGCAEKGLDITQGGASIGFTTLEAVTYATTVDSLLAVKYLVYDQRVCTMEELLTALKNNWQGWEKLQAVAKYKAPKFGRDDSEADALAKEVMDFWTNETWKYKTVSTGRNFRPGMLSWNYWAGDGMILPATPNGRRHGEFLSNAICPSNGADINGPTSNTNSVGNVLGGQTETLKGDWGSFLNNLPNGASHTISFNPSIMRSGEHVEKFKAFIKGYAENGGTALQINMVSPELLKEAQLHPQDYAHLLVRVTGYNAYFTTVGKELQDEIIARLSHQNF